MSLQEGMVQFCTDSMYRLFKEIWRINIFLFSGMTIHVVNANYGRLVRDDDSEENCAYGQEHNNDENCKLESR